MSIIVVKNLDPKMMIEANIEIIMSYITARTGSEKSYSGFKQLSGFGFNVTDANSKTHHISFHVKTGSWIYGEIQYTKFRCESPSLSVVAEYTVEDPESASTRRYWGQNNYNDELLGNVLMLAVTHISK